MQRLDGCQIPCLAKISDGNAEFGLQPIIPRIKRALAKPWNYHVKKWLKGTFMTVKRINQHSARKGTFLATELEQSAADALQAGDWVMVRPLAEIQKTLNPFKELKGCAFLEDMKQYCGTQQRVLKVMERFLDERDYQVKKTKGIVLLEGVYCQGTPVFGPCDRSCLSFWREEWLEKIELSG